MVTAATEAAARRIVVVLAKRDDPDLSGHVKFAGLTVAEIGVEK